jgi:hypothetical protein
MRNICVTSADAAAVQLQVPVTLVHEVLSVQFPPFLPLSSCH